MQPVSSFSPPTTSMVGGASSAPLQNITPTICQYNSAAVEKMKEGRFEEASLMLTQALRILETSSTRMQVDVPPVLCPLPNPCIPTTCGCLLEVSTRRRLNVRLPEADQSDNLNTAVYNRAFFIHVDDTVRNHRLDEAVLYFNSALCLHLQGVEHGDSAEKLNRALLLYSYAYSIVLEESALLSLANRASSRLIVLLAAALCHNMAAIHGDFWDFGRARFLRCQLAQVIHWEGSRFSQMETDDFVFFHLGIFFAIIDDFRIAPAA